MRFSRLNILGIPVILVAANLYAGPTVNVSVQPLALLAKEICADACTIVTLVPRGTSEHSWQPGPKEVVKLKESVASIGVGLGFDNIWFEKIGVPARSVLMLGESLSPMGWWSDDMTSQRASKADSSRSDRDNADRHSDRHDRKDIDKDSQNDSQNDSQKDNQNDSRDHSRDHSNDHSHDHSHDNGVDDPHVWTDAGRMSKAAGLIADHLAVFIPSAAAALKGRAKDISLRLEKLQLTVDERRKAWRTRPVVMFHDVAGYFARRFNLPVLSVTSGAAGHDYSARMIANVARKFKGVSVAGIMVEKEDGAAKSLARELKTTVKVVDFSASREYVKWDDWYLHIVSTWENILKS